MCMNNISLIAAAQKVRQLFKKSYKIYQRKIMRCIKILSILNTFLGSSKYVCNRVLKSSNTIDKEVSTARKYTEVLVAYLSVSIFCYFTSIPSYFSDSCEFHLQDM